MGQKRLIEIRIDGGFDESDLIDPWIDAECLIEFMRKNRRTQLLDL